MAHNALLRGGPGSGAWTGVVTSSEWELFDQRQFESINGDLGGTWAPAAQIVIGGAGINITSLAGFSVAGPTFINGTLTVNNTSHFLGDTIFGGSSTYTVETGATLDFQNGAHLTGSATASITWLGGAIFDTLVVDHAVVLGTTLAVTGAVTLSNALTVAGTLTVNSAQAIFSSGTTVTINSGIVMSGVGHIVGRPFTTASPPGSFLDSNYSISPATFGAGIATADIIQPGTLTANRSWTVLNTGAADGCTIEVSLIDCPIGFIVALLREDSSTIVSLTRTAVSGALFYACKLVKKSGAWAVHTVTRN